MNFLPEKIDEYAVAHSQDEPALLQELSKETWQKILAPRMLSGHFQGRILSMLSKLIQPTSILEIGTYTVYSALCLAEGITKTECYIPLIQMKNCSIYSVHILINRNMVIKLNNM